jgi:hypothetical protein
MSKQPTRVTYICRCEEATSVLVYPFIPAKLTGPPESCHEAEGGDYEPDYCEHCGQPITAFDIHDLAYDVEQGQREAAAEAKAEARMERGTTP